VSKWVQRPPEKKKKKFTEILVLEAACGDDESLTARRGLFQCKLVCKPEVTRVDPACAGGSKLLVRLAVPILERARNESQADEP
jgi:hypothetical protein